MSDDDSNYVLERRAQRDDIEEGCFDKIRAEAPSKRECVELFDHANKSYNAGDDK